MSTIAYLTELPSVSRLAREECFNTLAYQRLLLGGDPARELGSGEEGGFVWKGWAAMSPKEQQQAEDELREFLSLGSDRS